MKGLVDFHCHLDLYPNFADAIATCERLGIYTLTVTTTPLAWPRNFQLTRETKNVRAALGLHPQLVAQRANEIELWERYLPETRYVGEVGLDASPRFYKSINEQKTVFQRVLKGCARAGNKVLTVHSVRTAGVVLDLIEVNLPPSLGKVVLHWFTGSRAEARRAIDLGCYFSVNAQMLRSARSLDLIKHLPHERILTETDGPFTQVDGRNAQPADVQAAVSALAGTLNMEMTAVSKMVRQNLSALLT